MARLLAALLLLASAVAASAEPVVDGFEAETLGPLWNTRFVSSGRLTVQGDLVGSGAAALYVFPLRAIRLVTRFGMLAIFAVALLSGFAMAWLHKRIPRWGGWVLSGLVPLLLLEATSVTSHPAPPVSPDPDRRGGPTGHPCASGCPPRDRLTP